MFLLFFFFLFPALTFSLIALTSPIKHMGLYTSWITLCVILAYVEILKIPLENNYEILSRALTILVTIVYFSIAVNIEKSRRFRRLENKNTAVLKPEKESSTVLIARYLVCSAYGIATAYIFCLFRGNFFAGFQPALTAYTVASIGICIAFYLPAFPPLQKFKLNRVILRYFQSYIYSFATIFLYLVLFSLSFPSTVVHQTNSLINNYLDTVPAYCIQIVDSKWK